MISGMDVVVSKQLPITPWHGEVARRIVRHGLADVLAWLGEEVGPAPEALTHAIAGTDPAGPLGGVLLVSTEMHQQLRTRAAVEDLSHPDRGRRIAAELEWLTSARAHQRGRAHG